MQATSKGIIAPIANIVYFSKHVNGDKDEYMYNSCMF